MTLNWLSIFDTEHEAFIAACERVPLDAPVASCPSWSVGDLLYHIYEVQYLWHRVSAEARSGFDGLSMPVRPSDEALVDVLRGEHVSYMAWLRANDPASPQWTWTGMRDFQWLARRMAHELAVHRVDAGIARGEAGAIEPVLASDGIDEFLEFFRNGELNGSVHIHCTDVAGEWTIERDGTVRREHAKGDCAIRGAASDILLALWRRGALDACDVVGDATMAAHFIAASSLD